MHMADALVTPAVAGTAEPEADGDAYETAAPEICCNRI